MGHADRPPTPLPANRGQASAAERLGALHRVSGALTHDFNNLLGVILSATERLAGELPEGGEQQTLALLALEAAERSAELLRRALAVAQDGAAQDRIEPRAGAVDCGPALASLQAMARQAIAPGVCLTVVAPTRPLRCAAERTDLEMALLNLCLNAGQATPDGGGIEVQAREIELARAEARSLGLAPGAYVAFSVRDTGRGMSPETLARATEALFTTRATGTGLGLSAVVDFAAKADGALDLQSREGQGTTATLYLPAADDLATAAAA
jgi:signal transduction histidine kinase